MADEVNVLAADNERRQPRRQHRRSSWLFVAITLVIVIRASRNNSAADCYTGAGLSPGRRTVSPSPATTSRPPRFLGIAGAIAVNGYDGFLYSIGYLVAWLVALLLVAELLRNTGKFTMADVLSFRLEQRPVRSGRGHLHAGRLALLPAGADGRRRRARLAAAGHQATGAAKPW